MMTISRVFPSRQENCARAVAMSSGSVNSSASETTKSRPITRGQAARAHQDSLNRRKSDAVRARPLVPPSQYALQNLKAHLSSTCFLFLGSKAAPENASVRREKLCRVVDLWLRCA